MISTILTRIPLWVFPLFVGLMALGWAQTRTRKMARTRVVVMPLAMLLFSLISVVSSFGLSVLALFSWSIGVMLGGFLTMRFGSREGMAYDHKNKVFTLPGSYLPWALILGIFCLRFVVGAVSAGAGHLLHAPLAIALVALMGGFFSGCFFGRARALLQTQVVDDTVGGVATA